MDKEKLDPFQDDDEFTEDDSLEQADDETEHTEDKPTT